METSRAISSEISTQMSRKFDEMQTNLNSQILDVINAAIENKVVSGIKNAVKTQSFAKNTNLNLRSDGPHPSNFSHVHPQKDLQSNRLHPENVNYVVGDAQDDFSRPVTLRSDRINHCRKNSRKSHESDDENGYDRAFSASQNWYFVFPGCCSLETN